MTLYTLRYNNYYNRIKKGFNTVAEYQPFVAGTYQDRNFVPNDGISAGVVLNMANPDVDYLLVVDDENNIVSRWFIMEAVRNCKGQYQLSLLRDVIIDWKEIIYKSPMNISRAFLRNGDRSIFNDEGISVSQIKTAEYLLKDQTEAAWIVGYMANATNDKPTYEITYGYAEPNIDFTVSSLGNWTYDGLNLGQYAYVPALGQEEPAGYKRRKIDYLSLDINVGGTGNFGSLVGFRFDENGWETNTGAPSSGLSCGLQDDYEIAQTITSYDTTQMINKINAFMGLDTQKKNTDYINSLKGKKILVENTDTIYSIDIRTYHLTEDTTYNYKPNGETTPAVEFNSLVEYINTTLGENTIRTLYDTTNSYRVHLEPGWEKVIVLTKLNILGTDKANIPASTRSLTDAPYRMFCFPYSNTYKFYSGEQYYTTSRENALALACSLYSSLADACYDIQLLPYCPIGKLRNEGNTIDLTDWLENIDYVYFDKIPIPVFFAEESRGTFNIPFTQTGATSENSVITKTDALTKFSRLCSPNYQGVFEYCPIKNYGVNYINVDYEYKPINPYIHLNPDFYVRGLYGGDFNDARGLICGGDFSITQITNAWTQYQLQNKNYNEIFNRGIQKLELENKYAGIQDTVNMITGTLSGASSGAMAGGMSAGGHPAGFIVGGIIGAGGSFAGGLADMDINKKLRQENVSYTKDMHTLQLDNIKALPTSLAKVSTFNNNNKIWPFIEVYNATTEEYGAVYDYLRYNGMRVDRVGKIKDFLPNKPSVVDYSYIMAQPIRLEGLNEDAHVASVIATELQQGVYIE